MLRKYITSMSITKINVIALKDFYYVNITNMSISKINVIALKDFDHVNITNMSISKINGKAISHTRILHENYSLKEYRWFLFHHILLLLL